MLEESNHHKPDAFLRKGGLYRSRTWKYDKDLWDVLARVMELGNPDLLNHSLRVADFASKIARRLGLPDAQVGLIFRASLFHDIGKLGVSPAILSKPGSLTPNEYEIVKGHPELGEILLRECFDSRQLIPIVRHHHEHFNGKGYPDRIAGEQIPIEARILSVAEAIDSMSSNRPYCRLFSRRQVIGELERCSATQFDPAVVEAAVFILMDMDAAGLEASH
jgi:putative two-component system response regulator